MASLGNRIEHFIGRCLVTIRHHDGKLFTKTLAFKNQPKPTISVSSPECDDGEKRLRTCHTPMGENQFPQLQWIIEEKDDESVQDHVAEYILVVEDPDAPLPMPVVHGIYYAIPPSKNSLNPEDFEPTPGEGNVVRGGFKYGSNRMKSIWGGPKPVLGHGLHRYMFQIVSLRSKLDDNILGEMPTRADLEKAVEGNVMGWGSWVGTYERALP